MYLTRNVLKLCKSQAPALVSALNGTALQSTASKDATGCKKKHLHKNTSQGKMSNCTDKAQSNEKTQSAVVFSTKTCC